MSEEKRVEGTVVLTSVEAFTQEVRGEAREGSIIKYLIDGNEREEKIMPWVHPHKQKELKKDDTIKLIKELKKGYWNIVDFEKVDKVTQPDLKPTAKPESKGKSSRELEIRAAVAFKGAIDLASAGKVPVDEVGKYTVNFTTLLTQIAEEGV